MDQQRHYVFEHTECLRERDSFTPGGGGFALIAQNPVHLIGPHGDVQQFGPGVTLFSLLTDDLEGALKNMMSGTAASSDARFGASWVIAHRSHRPLTSSDFAHDEDGIDEWLNSNTAVLHGALPHTLRPDVEPGPFNALAEWWRALG